MKKRFHVSVENRRIVGDVYFPRRDSPPYVITSHGLYSTKESDKFTEIAGRFTKKGTRRRPQRRRRPSDLANERASPAHRLAHQLGSLLDRVLSERPIPRNPDGFTFDAGLRDTYLESRRRLGFR